MYTCSCLNETRNCLKAGSLPYPYHTIFIEFQHCVRQALHVALGHSEEQDRYNAGSQSTTILVCVCMCVFERAGG